MLTAGIVVKSCHTALQTFSCLFYQLSACATPLACGPLAQATCCFSKRRANNLFMFFTVCYSRPGLIFWGFIYSFSASSALFKKLSASLPSGTENVFTQSEYS
nr:MAG TPA: hypothetical protein [Caudoviricetes sp.]